MKVAFCLGSLNKGGAERVVCNLSNYLVDEGIEVIIIVTKLSNIEYYLKDNIKVFSLDESKKNSGIIGNIYRMNKISKIIKENNVNVILGFLQEPIARLLFMKPFYKSMKKIPLIISMRIDPKTAFNTLKRKLSLLLYNKADGYVFQTLEAQAFFNKEIQQKSVVIANSIDPHFFEIELKNIKRTNRIVSVGRITSQKNYPLLIEAFSEISKQHPEFTLEIYGDGPLKEKLERQIMDNNLEEKIKLMGNVKKIEDKICNATMFVITSDYEGMSNALMEAMALGLPSISTDSAGGGAATLIDSGKNGILIPVQSKDELVKNMNYLINDSDVRKNISIESRRSMLKYKPEIINKLWLDYIKKITRREK